MRQISLTDYLKLKHPEFFNKPKKQPKTLPYWWKGCGRKPQLDYFKISCVDHSATVMFYIEFDLNAKTQIYHYTVLYEDMHFVKDTFVYDGGLLTFDQYINETVKCRLCEMYVPYVPTFREAVIFNHI